MSPESTQPLLSVQSLEVRYGSVRAVRGVDLEVRENEVVCVLGANGAGKSSLLNSVAGLVAPATGSITAFGSDLTGRPAEKMVAAGVALVPEGRRVYGRLSVDENLRLGAAIRPDKKGVKEDREYVAELFPILSARSGQAAGTLSGGQQQMLAIARALMCRPRLLLLDEPSLGLAPIIVDQIFELLPALRARGITILLVEQNATRALEIADRGYLLTTGRVTATGSSQELLATVGGVEALYFGARG